MTVAEPSGLRSTSSIGDEWRYPASIPRETGMLRVDANPDHTLFWAEYGDPNGEPVIVLHGGPGGASSPQMARFFDPARYRVLLFDQRGCGLSVPTVAVDGAAAALARNTTQNLIADIDKLRSAREITGKMHVFGGSWGSTLALAYGIARPENCQSLILRGIFLGDPKDLLYIYQGNAATFDERPYALEQPGAYAMYPEAWKTFLSVLNAAERTNVMRSFKAIFDMVASSPVDRKRQLDAAKAWSAWEGTIAHMVPASTHGSKYEDDAFALSFAQIEAHYFMNDLFLPENFVLDNAPILTSMPVHIVHGRFDQLCPLHQAFRLSDALTRAGREPESFIITMAGHSAMERETALALTCVMDRMPRLL